MCTLIVNWDRRGIVVGANRDEDLKRPSETFKHRDNIFCPLDVRGGSWIGINNSGMFVGLTNLDEYFHNNFKKKTRGRLVMSTLTEVTALNAVNKLMIEESPERYSGCTLLIADKKKLFSVIFNGANIQSEELQKGLYVSTGWGLNNEIVPRYNYIKDNFHSTDLKDILKFHYRDDVEYEVCVHDPAETHQTRSSCIIKSTPRWENFIVEYTDKRPCQTKRWNQEIVKIK